MRREYMTKIADLSIFMVFLSEENIQKKVILLILSYRGSFPSYKLKNTPIPLRKEIIQAPDALTFIAAEY